MAFAGRRAFRGHVREDGADPVVAPGSRRRHGVSPIRPRAERLLRRSERTLWSLRPGRGHVTGRITPAAPNQRAARHWSGGCALRATTAGPRYGGQAAQGRPGWAWGPTGARFELASGQVPTRARPVAFGTRVHGTPTGACTLGAATGALAWATGTGPLMSTPRPSVANPRAWGGLSTSAPTTAHVCLQRTVRRDPLASSLRRQDLRLLDRDRQRPLLLDSARGPPARTRCRPADAQVFSVPRRRLSRGDRHSTPSTWMAYNKIYQLLPGPAGPRRAHPKAGPPGGRTPSRSRGIAPEPHIQLRAPATVATPAAVSRETQPGHDN